MGMKRYVDLDTLYDILDNLKTLFSNIFHTHTKSEIIDLVIDTELSSTSENLVQNKVVSSAIESTKNYVDVEIANLVNSAPETMDTLGELAAAFEENEDMVEALNAAITHKADKEEILLYIDNRVPAVTTEDVGKFLRVQDDGTWAAESIAIAEEGSF